MEIKLNLNLSPVPPTPEGAGKARSLPATVSDTEFGRSAALDQALKQTPDVRAEAVARARELVGTQAYPPIEMINKIANLLALHIHDETP